MKKFIKVSFVILVIFLNFAINSFAEETLELTKEIIDEEIDNIENVDNVENINNNKINELEAQKQDLESQTEEYNSKLQFVTNELTQTVVEISELTQEIFDKQTEIDQLKAKEKLLSERIEKVEAQLEQANENYFTQKELLEKRLVAMYEMGETSYLDLLLSSKKISDFLSNYYYISEIANTDNELLKIVKEQKENIQSLMNILQEDEKNLEDSKNDLEKATIAMSNMVIVKNQKLQNLSSEELILQAQVEEYQSQIQKIESEIRLLSLISDNSEYVGGSFMWPVPGYTRISSPFGMRTHPITGIYKLHTGTDISAPFGSTFVAANDGIVTKADFNAAYGNMVIIDHGGGISTLYAHGSEILVEVGQTITQGTPVLKVGSTGYSTGPHAHFEIRIKGEYINPMDYLPSENIESEEAKTETVELEAND